MKMLNMIEGWYPGFHPEVHLTARGTQYLQEPGCQVLCKPNTNLHGLHPFFNAFNQNLGFRDYLQDDMITSLPPAATLIKFAGQGCFASFGPRRRKNAQVQEYMDNILSSGHGCYDADTDVLTSAGWKPWPEVTKNDELASLDAEGALIYVRPVRVIQARHTGPMYRVESQEVDLLVTPDHNMFVCRTTTREGRKRAFESYQLVKADALGHVSHAYLKRADWLVHAGRTDKVEMLKFLGFAIGDGYYKNGNMVRFRLRRLRKTVWLRNLTTRLGWLLQFDGTDRYTVTVSPECKELVARMYREDGAKQIPQEVLTTHSRDELLGLLEGLLEADGHHSDTGDCFDTTSETLVDQLQQLCLHVGLAANVNYCYGPDQRPTSFGKKPLTRLQVIRRRLRPEVNKWTEQKGRTSWIDHWEGDVYCAEMPTNTRRVVYVRRNGKPVWCGNSVLEHAMFVFFIYGVSRSLTHELVRHRVGISISQLSQRFVDGSILRFVEGPEHQDDPVLHERFERAIDNAAAEYEARAARLMEKQAAKDPSVFTDEDRKTDLRKRVNQAARRCLPNETETWLTFGVNVRSARHILEMRAAKSAEVEIRRLGIMMYKCLQYLEPHLFKDYEIHDLGDGTQGLETTYRKV
jgi:thymidylate synthase (FAD)